MMTSIRELNRVLRKHDSCLYAVNHKPGRVDVYRKSSLGGAQPYFVFSLTDNWQPSGIPIFYGIDVVMNRIKAHDLWRDDSFVENWIKQDDKRQESSARANRNSIESFLYDFRSQFHKATNDINTSTLNKNFERKVSNGSC